MSDEFIIRGPDGLKGRAVECSRKENTKLTPWLIEAIEEKIASSTEVVVRCSKSDERLKISISTPHGCESFESQPLTKGPEVNNGLIGQCWDLVRLWMCMYHNHALYDPAFIEEQDVSFLHADLLSKKDDPK